MKRIIALTLSLILCCCLLPVRTEAASGAGAISIAIPSDSFFIWDENSGSSFVTGTNYYYYCNGSTCTSVTSNDNWTISVYAPVDMTHVTMTLNNFNYESAFPSISTNFYVIEISGYDVTLILQGTNKINCCDNMYYCYGIYTDCDLTIRGLGSLTIGDTKKPQFAIYSKQNIYLNGVNNILLNDKNDGIHADKQVVIENSKLEIHDEGRDCGSAVCAIHGNTGVIIGTSSNVTAVSDKRYAIYSYDGNVLIENSTVSASSSGTSTDMAAIYSDKANVSISYSNVNASGAHQGIGANSLSVVNSTVNVTASDSDAICVDSGNVTVSNSDLVASTKSAGNKAIELKGKKLFVDGVENGAYQVEAGTDSGNATDTTYNGQRYVKTKATTPLSPTPTPTPSPTPQGDSTVTTGVSTIYSAKTADLGVVPCFAGAIISLFGLTVMAPYKRKRI